MQLLAVRPTTLPMAIAVILAISTPAIAARVQPPTHCLFMTDLRGNSTDPNYVDNKGVPINKWPVTEFPKWLQKYDYCMDTYWPSQHLSAMFGPKAPIVAGVHRRIAHEMKRAEERQEADQEHQAELQAQVAELDKKMQTQATEQRRREALVAEEQRQKAATQAKEERIAKAQQAQEQEKRQIDEAIQAQRLQDEISEVDALPIDQSSLPDLDKASKSSMMQQPRFAEAVRSKRISIARANVEAKYIKAKNSTCASDADRRQVSNLMSENGIKVLNLFDIRSRAEQWVNRVKEFPPELIQTIKDDNKCLGTALTSKDQQLAVQYGPETIGGKTYFHLKMLSPGEPANTMLGSATP